MITNILVLTAFQEGSHRALRMAAEIGLRFQAKVHVLHVINQDLVEEVSTAMGVGTEEGDSLAASGRILAARLAQQIPPALDVDGVASGLVTRAERRMRDFVVGLDPALKLDTDIQIGQPYEVILEAVAHRQIDLVVMGRSNHGIKEFLLGSIADKVVRTVACPVCLL